MKPTLEQIAVMESPELDEWVARAEGANVVQGYLSKEWLVNFPGGCSYNGFSEDKYAPSINPAQTYPIWVREGISVEPWSGSDRNVWVSGCPASPDGGQEYMKGPTPLIAICRARVAAWITKQE